MQSVALIVCHPLEELKQSVNTISISIQGHRYEMGPIVSFNLKRPDGSWYGYREVEKLASLSGIQLRVIL